MPAKVFLAPIYPRESSMNKETANQMAKAEAYAMSLYAAKLREVDLPDIDRQLIRMVLALAYTEGRQSMLKEVAKVLE
jgi:hypothetical protein